MKVAIVGGGKLGTNLTKALVGAGNEITVIDTNAAVISRTNDNFDVMTVQKDARNIETLKGIGISSYDAAICVTSDDETNIFIASMAKSLGCKYTVARVRDPEHVSQFEDIKNNFSIDYIANSDYACAKEIFKYLTDKQGVWGKRFIIDKTEIFEIDINQIPSLIGKTLKESSDVFKDLLLVAISRSGRIVIPNGSTEFAEADRLFISGEQKNIIDFRKKLVSAASESKMKNVMIGGGGKMSFFLAQMLERSGIGVKIVERDPARCTYLSEKLDKSLILQGNAADTKIMLEEGIKNCDAYIAATSSDEQNLLVGLQAQILGVKECVAKVSSMYYTDILKFVDYLMVINPVDMCSSDILRRITNDVNITFRKMLQGQAELIEITAEEGMMLTSSSLAELNIPEGVIIVSVSRNKEIIMPTGKTKIQPGDKVILLSLLTAVGERESLLSSAK